MSSNLITHLGGRTYAVQGSARTPYTVDLAVESCTCPAWGPRYAKYAQGDERRYCKHMRMVRDDPMYDPALNESAVLDNAKLALVNEITARRKEQLEEENARLRARISVLEAEVDAYKYRIEELSELSRV